MSQEMLEAALDYLARGWCVIPLRPRDKRPLRRWQRYQERPPARHEVIDWFRRWPAANLAIVTGLVSDLVVLDVDPAHGGDASLTRLQRRHGALPVTLTAETGGGGHHLYFHHPGHRLPNRAGLAPGLDLRADGGYVVAPPSVHPSGIGYRWRRGCAPGECEPAPLPAWLIADPGTDEGGPRGHPPGHWSRLIAEGVEQGRRNQTVASLAGHLLQHRLDATVVTALLLCWNRARCRPPLADEEVSRTVDSIARREAGRIRDDHTPFP